MAYFLSDLDTLSLLRVPARPVMTRNARRDKPKVLLAI
jgi:hypothetical protein